MIRTLEITVQSLCKAPQRSNMLAITGRQFCLMLKRFGQILRTKSSDCVQGILGFDEASGIEVGQLGSLYINDILSRAAGLFPVLCIVVSCRNLFVKEDPLQQGLKISGQEFHCPKHVFFSKVCFQVGKHITGF